MDSVQTVKEAMLTTVDNEFDPFDEFAEWYSRDITLAMQQNRRSASGYLAIIAACSEDLSDNEYNQVMNDAIDEIVELDLSGTFKKVTREPKVEYVQAS